MAILTGLNVSVFNVGGTSAQYVDSLASATVTIDNDTEETAAVKDSWAAPITLQYGWRIEADVYASSTAPLMVLACGSAPSAAVTFTYGGKTYSGNVLLRCNHALGKGVQKHSLTLLGNGALTHS